MVGIVTITGPSFRPPTLSLSLSLAQFDFNFYKIIWRIFLSKIILVGRHNEEVNRRG
jgi:hypothetical protein